MAFLGYPRGHRIDPETRCCLQQHTKRLMSFIWACGPPIDMKIRSRRRVRLSSVDGKGRLHSG
jgi:hypothetical protein